MNPLHKQNYLALDLELNQNPETKVPKIIEVGIAIGNPEEGVLLTQNWYIDPQEPLVPFITQLTGINEEIIVSKGRFHSSVAKEIGELIDLYEPFINPVTWGQGDVDELLTEFSQNEVKFPYFGRRIIDVKTMYVFNQLATGRTAAGGLRKSMIKYGIEFVGTSHRASVDALNTLKFFFFLMERQRKLEEMIATCKGIKY